MKALTYDDIQLTPQFSNVKSRSNVSLETQLTKNYKLTIPIIGSPMDTVCGFEMARKLMKMGGVGCIHRFMSSGRQSDTVERLSYERDVLINKTLMGEHRKNPMDVDEIEDRRFKDKSKYPIMAAVGVGEEEFARANSLIRAGANVILIDVAHGHHKNVKIMIEVLTKFRESSGLKFDIIAGNVATYDGALDLCKWGVDGVRCGQGGGSLCSTRIETGHGIPNVTSIRECVDACSQYDVPVMADGGIRMAGDIAKAIAVGADTVMLGSLLAGTTESPGDVLEKGNHLFKKYRGSASLETKSAHGQKSNHIEGVSTTIPYKGGVKFVIHRLMDGLRSALSYTGAHTIQEYQSKADWVEVTNAGIAEAKPHLTR